MAKEDILKNRPAVVIGYGIVMALIWLKVIRVWRDAIWQETHFRWRLWNPLAVVMMLIFLLGVILALGFHGLWRARDDLGFGSRPGPDADFILVTRNGLIFASDVEQENAP